MCNINIDDCAINPCHNGGTCVDGINSFTCLCPEGYNDETCLSQVDECGSNPCIHGRCHDLINGWAQIQIHFKISVKKKVAKIKLKTKLTCLFVFIKATNAFVTRDGVAQTAISITMSASQTRAWMGEPAKTWPADITAHAELASLVSYNLCNLFYLSLLIDNDCVPWLLISNPSVISNPTTVGPNCQTNINECASNPCLNQGTCIDDVAGYKCNCLLPYTGMTYLVNNFITLVFCLVRRSSF